MPVAQINFSNVSEEPQWYAVVTQFNYEKKYAENINLGMQGAGMDGYIKEILVPIYEEDVFKTLKSGKTKKTKKVHKLYPLYVFVKCIMNARVWSYLRMTTGAATILATGGVPVEMSVDDIKKIKDLCNIKEEEIELSFEVDDLILINAGIFKGKEATVKEINKTNKKAKLILKENDMLLEMPLSDLVK